MKKVFITIIMAILLGCVFAFFFFKDNNKKEVVSTYPTITTGYAFQVGVYRNLDNAKKEANKYVSGTIITDNEFNRVYIGLGKNLIVLDKLKEYYNSKNINYYMRRIDIPKDFSETFNMYEQVLRDTNDIDIISKQFLKEYQDFINGVHN